jgi:hypothetical protein
MTWWDPACEDAVRVVMKAGKASRQVIMKGLGVGYGRAEFLLNILERRGVVCRGKRNGYRLLKRRKSS